MSDPTFGPGPTTLLMLLVHTWGAAGLNYARVREILRKVDDLTDAQRKELLDLYRRSYPGRSGV